MASGSDFLSLRAEDVPARGKAGWLVDRVRDAYGDGTVVAGTRLPTTRQWAEELAVSRGVVVEAFRRLADEGIVASRTGSGTEITDLLTPTVQPQTAQPGTGRIPSAQPPAGQSPTVRERSDGFEIDLTPGVPDLSAFPRAAWLRAEREVFAGTGAEAFGYGDPRGHAELRSELARRLARLRGVRCGPDDIVIVSGVAQALAVLARVLPAHGIAGIGMEDPGSHGVRTHIAAWGPPTLPVPVDGDGLDVRALRESGAAAVVVTPAHQLPTGVVLGPQRRRDLVSWAADGGLVIEDDYDAEHRYDRAPVPALHPSAPHAIAYTGSVSKTLSPGLRLGWLIPPPHLREAVIEAKYSIDIATATLPQLILARMMGGGDLDRQLRTVRIRQRARRDALVAALAEYAPRARVHGVAAGLHLLLSLPAGYDDAELAAAIGRSGVRVQPLSMHRVRPGPPGLIIGYAAHPAGRLTEAARRIGSAL